MKKYVCDICNKEINLLCGSWYPDYIVLCDAPFGGKMGLDVCGSCIDKIKKHYSKISDGICGLINEIDDDNKVEEPHITYENDAEISNDDGDLKHCALKGVRQDRKTRNWEAHIRFKNVEYQLGYHGKAEDGLLSAISARVEAAQVRDSTPEQFDDWYSQKYPDYSSIDRKARGYSH